MKSDLDDRTTIINNIDFKDGLLQDPTEELLMNGLIIDVRWPKNIHFHCYRQWNRYRYAVVKNNELISSRYYVSKLNEHFYKSVQKLVNEISNGDFDNKKTQSEKVMEIIQKRNLSSYMNKTKWKEFLYAMTEEMPLAIPYDYKTLFEDNREKLLFGTSYDIESFNYYYFKSIEWVKLKPKFSEHVHRGRFMSDEIIYHDVEKEFLALMEKYHIPLEYDSREEVYVIYGYK